MKAGVSLGSSFFILLYLFFHSNATPVQDNDVLASKSLLW